MLTAYEQDAASQTASALPSGGDVTASATVADLGSGEGKGRLAHALKIEWLGQMAASLCWIISVFAYGISSTGDWLQLCAASAWLLANLASLANAGD